MILCYNYEEKHSANDLDSGSGANGPHQRRGAESPRRCDGYGDGGRPAALAGGGRDSDVPPRSQRDCRNSQRRTPRADFDSRASATAAIPVEVEHEDFARSVTPLQVSGRASATLTIKLSLSSVVTKVTVVGDEPAQVSTDISENLDTASVDQNLLEKVPVFDQDYVTAMSAFLDAGAIGTSGVQTIVNGVEVTSVTVSASAVQEVRINQNPYSAEYARPGRGGIEIITKEAGSDYHGTFNFIFRDSVLNARDPFALVRAPEQRRIFEGAFSGPIGQSKSWSFMLSGHRQEEDLQSIVFAQDLSGPVQESVPSPKRDTLFTLHVGHQFSENHVAYWQYTEWDYPSSNQGVGGFVLPEAATNSDQWERAWVFNDRHTISPHLLFQFQVLVGWEHHATTSVNSAPEDRGTGCIHLGRGADRFPGRRTQRASECRGELDARQASREVRAERARPEPA